MLLTRAPLYQGRSPFSCDLHVLGAPLTFVLSQDQTLQLNLVSSRAFLPKQRPRALAWKKESHFDRQGRLAPSVRGLALSRDPLVDALDSFRYARGVLRAYDSVFKERGRPACLQVPM